MYYKRDVVHFFTILLCNNSSVSKIIGCSHICLYIIDDKYSGSHSRKDEDSYQYRNMREVRVVFIYLFWGRKIRKYRKI